MAKELATVAKQMEKHKEFYTLNEMAEKLFISPSALRNRIERGVYPGAVKHMGYWIIPKSEAHNEFEIPGGYYTVREVAERTGLRISGVHVRIQSGKYPGSYKRDGVWLIPKELVDGEE